MLDLCRCNDSPQKHNRGHSIECVPSPRNAHVVTVTGELADTPTRGLVNSRMSPLTFCSLFFYHQQIHQLYANKTEEQNIHNKQKTTLYRTFSYLQNTYKNKAVYNLTTAVDGVICKLTSPRVGVSASYGNDYRPTLILTPTQSYPLP